MTTVALPHRWQFLRAGGSDQVALERGADILVRRPTTANADTAQPPEMKKIDVGTVAALGVAFGALAAATFVLRVLNHLDLLSKLTGGRFGSPSTLEMLLPADTPVQAPADAVVPVPDSAR